PASSPAPRLRARSMLSLGTEDFFAFWMASYSVGLPSGSPPPVRAATSMFLINFAKSFPRFASIAAFLCLVVAHLEWPLIPLLPSVRLHVWRVYVTRSVSGGPHDVDEHPVYPQVTGDLRMERRGQHVALAHGHDPAPRRAVGHGGQHLHTVAR